MEILLNPSRENVRYVHLQCVRLPYHCRRRPRDVRETLTSLKRAQSNDETDRFQAKALIYMTFQNIDQRLYNNEWIGSRPCRPFPPFPTVSTFRV